MLLLLASSEFQRTPKGEVRRITIPRTPVNKGKKSPGCYALAPFPHPRSSLRWSTNAAVGVLML
jgi:hypothetical protein